MTVNKMFRLAAALTLGMAVMAFLAPAPCQAQIFQLSKEELIALTSTMPGTWERFADGRPKVPDAMLERAKGLSSEEMMGNQYTDGFQVLHPGKKMVGRAFTLAFMPGRPELDGFARSRAQKAGITGLNNQTVIDMLEPGDILCVDLFGKKQGGTIVGDNLFYYIMRATKGAGLVVDGSIRDLEGIAPMEMPLYFMHTDPSAIGQATLAGWNIPVKIGTVTVRPGDLVLGDQEGLNFVSPNRVEQMLDRADETHVHDEWTRKQFDTGKYKSSEIYGSPRDPEKKKEYQEYLKKRLEEIRKK
jgi:4-hydroxy-4-methyl-2-oxoglutarate aldolase